MFSRFRTGIRRRAHCVGEDILGKAYEKGLVLLSCGSRGNVIRFLPALNISDELINEGMDIVAECLAELVK